MQKEVPRENTGKLRKYMTSEVKLKNLFLDAGCKNNTEHNIFKGSLAAAFIVILDGRICNAVQIMLFRDCLKVRKD